MQPETHNPFRDAKYLHHVQAFHSVNKYSVLSTRRYIANFELHRLGRAGFHTSVGYNHEVNVVMKVGAGTFREAIMKTTLD